MEDDSHPDSYRYRGRKDTQRLEGHSPPEILDYIHYKRKRRITRAALTGRADLGMEDKLMQRLTDEEREVRDMKTCGLNPIQIRKAREDSGVIKDIKRLLIDLGIAKMLTIGDWIVNRRYEIPRSMGVVQFDELMQLMSAFCLMNNITPSKGTHEREYFKLIAVDMGCGDGKFCEVLRADTYRDGESIWEIFGYADCIYFALNDFLKNLVKIQHRKHEILMEFVDVISTLLIRKIHTNKTDNKDLSESDKTLQALTLNLNLIREVLPNLEEFISLKNIEKLKVDTEFLSDAEREISPECQRLIREYLRSPEDFVDKCFKAEIKDLSEEEKNRLEKIESERNFLHRTAKRDSGEITQPMIKLEMKELERRRAKNMQKKLAALQKTCLEAIANAGSLRTVLAIKVKYLSQKGALTKILRDLQDLSESDRDTLKKFSDEIRDKLENAIKMRQEEIRQKRITGQFEISITDEFKRLDEEQAKAARQSGNQMQNMLSMLKQEEKEILEKVPDLSGYISLSHHNVIPGQFADFNEVFEKSTVNFIWSFRATSHLEDDAYFQVLRLVACSLAPGGIFIDDGKRESWTRFERIENLETLSAEMDKEYRIRIIAEENNANSVLLERGVRKPGGNFMFLSDQFGKEMLREGCEFIDVEGWSIKQPQVFVRNKVIEILRKSLAGLQGRKYFKDAHPAIQEKLDKIFQNEKWNRLFEAQGDMPSNVVQIAKIIARKVARVVKRGMDPEIRDKYDSHPIPLRKDSAVRTFSRSRDFHGPSYINKPRTVPVEALPRNVDFPSEDALAMRKYELVYKLGLLLDYFKKPPVRIVEFGDCFTNDSMIEVIRNFFKGFDVNFKDYVRVYNVQLQSKKPPIPSLDVPINIIGGSTNSAYDKHGKSFTERYCMPLIDKIGKGEPSRVLGVCFGSDSLTDAFGRLIGKNFRTVPGALQLGAFPIAFAQDNKRLLQELAGGRCTIGITREDYTLVEGYEKLGEDMVPIAFELEHNDGNLSISEDLPPIAFSILGGKVVTAKFHPELELKKLHQAEHLKQWLLKSHELICFGFDNAPNPPHYMFKRQFNIEARVQDDITQWIENDVGPLFLLNTLLDQVNSVLEQLSLGQ